MTEEIPGATATEQAPPKPAPPPEERKPVLPQLDEETTRRTRLYEALILLDPAEATRTWDKLTAWMHELIGDKLGQHVLRIDKWADGKKLAYEIRGMKRATFMLVWFRSEPPRLGELERAFRLDERVVRYLLTVHEEEPPNVGMTAEDMEQAAPAKTEEMS